jgi:hypothetical protein
MSKEKKYLNCRYFDTIKCPERKNETMRRFISETTIPESSSPIKLNFDNADEINKLCFKCDVFKAH